MIDAAFQADPDLARQLDMNRAGTRWNHCKGLRLRKLLVLGYAHPLTGNNLIAFAGAVPSLPSRYKRRH